jgi:hypothetical protein
MPLSHEARENLKMMRNGQSITYIYAAIEHVAEELRTQSPTDETEWDYLKSGLKRDGGIVALGRLLNVLRGN